MITALRGMAYNLEQRGSRQLVCRDLAVGLPGTLERLRLGRIWIAKDDIEIERGKPVELIRNRPAVTPTGSAQVLMSPGSRGPLEGPLPDPDSILEVPKKFEPEDLPNGAWQFHRTRTRALADVQQPTAWR